MAREKIWVVYILRCGDGTLYTGMSGDFAGRVLHHADGRGAKYTRGRGPFKVLLLERHPSKSAALKREYAIKRMTRAQKLKLCNNKT